ncbi:MAG: ATP-binding cassette domain-containing protein [Bacteroidota bacterium]
MSEVRTALQLANVSVSIGDRVLLDKQDLRISLGEFVFLVGPTGSGKSTLLKLLYADRMPDRGKIQVGKFRVDQITAKDIPLLRRTLGIVFQDFQLLPDRNVRDNIAFALRATGWKDKSKMIQRINEVLLKVGLTGKGRALPHQLSGGEQQRVVIARALINDPLVLIADEPTGNLDPVATQHIMELLRSINRGGTAVIMATHEYPLLKQFPSRVLEINQGILTDHASTESFLAQFAKG